MDLKDFKFSLSSLTMPGGLRDSLQAMWHDAKGDWNRAHEIAQEINTPEGSWIHAYLHRKEGDESNAAYWYHRAHRAVSRTSLEEEWEQIVTALLQADLHHGRAT
jgi:hypothetical protein